MNVGTLPDTDILAALSRENLFFLHLEHFSENTGHMIARYYYSMTNINIYYCSIYHFQLEETTRSPSHPLQKAIELSERIRHACRPPDLIGVATITQ